ncbi:MAG: type III-A CRISPR-associated RAMP protein Csm3 [Desulfurococcales archaeon ex4484_58]|nr:MAG: type III-A CRISPR-associated RAMP protein Csm3 [Desulfurococcales archaeon ex4484_58]
MSKVSPTINRNLKGIIKFDVVFENTTGLLIRMPTHAQVYRIGGADQYPMTTRKRYGDNIELEVPLIPGSSLKGRMRSLLETSMNLPQYTLDYKIWQHVRNPRGMSNEDLLKDIENRCIIDELFGWSAFNFEQLEKIVGEVKGIKDKEKLREATMEYFEKLAPTRLLVDDFTPTEECINKLNATSIADFLEEKMENRIDRITSAADPRSIVRVKPGIEFGGCFKIMIYDIDRDVIKNYLKILANGLKLVEETYLGGSGSRGYGRIRFRKIHVSVLKISNKEGKDFDLDKTKLKEELKEYSSVDELLDKIDELAKEIENILFGE